MTQFPRHSVSVAAVVTDEGGRVLVIQRRDKGAWEIPGGILELDETPQAGVRREVLEETGVEIEPERLTGIYKTVTVGIVALVFRARLVAGSPAATEEAAAVDWWTADQVAAGMSEVFAVRTLDALGAHPTPAVRSHDGRRFVDRHGQYTRG